VDRLLNYFGGEEILSPPLFQHCGGERAPVAPGSDAFGLYTVYVHFAQINDDEK